MVDKKPEYLLKVQEEIALMKLCKANNIIKHIETYYFEETIFMFVDYMNAGSLTNLISCNRQMPEPAIAYVLR